MDDHTLTELDQLRVRTQADLQRLWELVMQPLGFRSTSLWVTFIGSDERPTRFLMEIAESDELPTPDEVDNLFDVLRQVLAEDPDDPSVAFLITRPGRGGTTAFDRELSALLLDGARASGVPVHPVHVADDVAVHAVTPDDLAA
jgi:hypothetical protein